MAIQQRNNEDEGSGAIKTEGQSTEEFKAGIKGNDYIKMNESQMKKLSQEDEVKKEKHLFVGPVNGRFYEDG